MWILPRTRVLSSSSISISRFPSHCSYYSTTTTTFVPAHETTQKNGTSENLMLDYLVNSIGLSRQEAISASKKVSHLKSTQNPDSVINFFKIYGGLDESQIKDVVFNVPHVLTHKANQTLESKFKVLKEYGLSGVSLVRQIKRQPKTFARGLDTYLVPNLSYLSEFLGGCNENLLKALNRGHWLLGSNVRSVLEPNLLLFKDIGFSKDELQKFFVTKPRAFMLKPESLQKVIKRVDKLGIPRDSGMFIRGVFALTEISDAIFEKKARVYRSFGWSDNDVLTLFRTLPQCLVISEEKIRNGLNFFMKELGYAPADLASRGACLSCSLEKRVKPRYEVLKTLKEHKLVKSDQPLYSFIKYPEEKFLMKFVLPHRDKIPSLYETYTAGVRNLSKA